MTIQFRALIVYTEIINLDQKELTTYILIPKIQRQETAGRRALGVTKNGLLFIFMNNEFIN